MKTPDLIKKGLECYVRIYAGVCPPNCLTNECDLYTGNYSTTENVSDALTYIQQLEAATPKWISVEERLPQVSDLVLVIANGTPRPNVTLHDAVLIASYWGKEGWIADGFDGWCGLNVSHWMPLPKGPKEG